jgi:hypothetical protein
LLLLFRIFDDKNHLSSLISNVAISQKRLTADKKPKTKQFAYYVVKIHFISKAKFHLSSLISNVAISQKWLTADKTPKTKQFAHSVSKTKFQFLLEYENKS